MCILHRQNASDIFVATKMLNCTTMKESRKE